MRTVVDVQSVGKELKAGDVHTLDLEEILGACVITRFQKPGAETLYGIVFENKNSKDNLNGHTQDVFRFGFVFGGQEEGETILDAAMREADEELLDFRPQITEENFLGLIWVVSDNTLMPKAYAVFLLDLPYDTVVRPGKERLGEQAGALKLPKEGWDGIDKLIADELLFMVHGWIWEKFQPQLQSAAAEVG